MPWEATIPPCRRALGDYNCAMIDFADEPDNHVKELLTLGERLGYLTYEMLNERLGDKAVTPEKLDAILMMIDERGIRLIDEADIPRAS
jgi:hypothetical protein